MSFRPMAFLLVFGCVASLKLPAQAPLIPPPPAIAGTVKVLGRTVSTTYDFDHNALHQAVRSGRSIVALTGSGNLLRFDPDTLALTGEHVVIGGGSALAASDAGRVYVGTENGHIDEVDVDTWVHRTIAATPGAIRWIGRRSAGRIVAVAASPREREIFPGEDGRHLDGRRAEASLASPLDAVITVDRAGTRRFEIEVSHDDILTASFGLDESGLWMGTNFGEFGGSLRRIDLETGKLRQFKFDGNTRGFLEASDGTLYVFGGTTHFWSSSGFVARVHADREPETIQEFDNEKPESPNKPSGPIDLLVERAARDGFWAVSNHLVYRVNASMRDWPQAASLGGRWIAGAAYAIANTQTAAAVLTDPSRPDELIGVMGRDGLRRISRSGETARMFAGQLELDAKDIWASPIGTLLLGDWRSWSLAVRLTGVGWDDSAFQGVEADPAGWDDCMVAGGAAGSIVLYCSTGGYPGDRALIRLGANGVRQVVERWTGSESPHDGWLTTKDGRTVMVDGDKLKTRQAGRWEIIGTNAIDDEETTGIRALVARRYLPLGQDGGREYFLDADFGLVVSLGRTANGRLELRNARGQEWRGPYNTFDAFLDVDHTLITASPTGLARFRLTDAGLEWIEGIPSPNRHELIESVTRDATGRLWAGGDAIYVSAPGTVNWEAVPLSMVTAGTTKRIRPDGEQGVLITLGRRGAVRIR